jgi:hypothetical protein
MNITDFLDKHNIEWTPIRKLLNKGGLEGDFILIDTNKVHQLDVDEPCDTMHKLIGKTPYYKSVTKRLPHFFCTIEAPGITGLFRDEKIDYFRGVPVYAHRDAIVFDAELSIKNIINSRIRD